MNVPRTATAQTSPAAAVMRGFIALVVAALGPLLHHPFGWRAAYQPSSLVTPVPTSSAASSVASAYGSIPIRVAGSRPAAAPRRYAIGSECRTARTTGSGRSSRMRKPRAKRSTTAARDTVPPGITSSGGAACAHSRYSVSGRPSQRPAGWSLSSGTTTSGTPRPSSASSAVSRVRTNSVTVQRSIGSSAIASPSRRACARPSSVNETAMDGSPFRVPRALYALSACRARRSLSTSEDQRPVRAPPLHADGLVDADRRGVLGPHEQADDRHTPQQHPDQVAHRPLRIAVISDRRVDPDLLELHCGGRPRGRLRLEEDGSVVTPDP